MKWQMMLAPTVLVLVAGCGDKGDQKILEPTIVTELTVTPDIADLLVGEEVQLKAQPVDQDGNAVGRVHIDWSTPDTAVARVVGWGLVKAVGPGSARVTAKCQSVEGFATCEGLEVSVIVTVHGWAMEVDGHSGGLYGVWGSSASDVFAVGTGCEIDAYACGGTILHYDGSAWTKMATRGIDVDLVAVWGRTAHDVFVVGPAGTILHYDGTTWVRMQSGTTDDFLRAVWGSSAEDVFAVGSDPTFRHPVVLHYDGQRWASMVMPTEISRGTSLTGVWGSSDADVFAVGLLGTILHYDGIAWTRMTSPVPEALLGVWGTSSANVFAVGVGGTLLHYDGAAWNIVPTTTTHDLMAISGAQENDVFVVGADDTFLFAGSPVILHYDGAGWTVLEKVAAPGLYAVWATAHDVFAVGPGPTIVHGRQ